VNLTRNKKIQNGLPNDSLNRNNIVKIRIRTTRKDASQISAIVYPDILVIPKHLYLQIARRLEHIVQQIFRANNGKNKRSFGKQLPPATD
jgi:hypothetical protein